MKPVDTLLFWYQTHGRKLPWRRTRDPYKIVVSELMLQQTQVARVKEYFWKPWLAAYPDWAHLAKASNAQVLRSWAGLGYNRRALALRDMARVIVKEGEPKDRAGWLALKGIGPYTADAIMAFAYKKPVVPIDTNIRRFAGRYFLGDPYPQPSQDAALKVEAEVFAKESQKPHDIPQAIFDLATEYCTKKPNCQECPMRKSCPAANLFLSGSVEVPKQMVKRAKEKRHRNKPHPDRIYRGRILKVLRERGAPIALNKIGPGVDPDYVPTKDLQWIKAMVDRLAKDGMVSVVAGRVQFGENKKRPAELADV